MSNKRAHDSADQDSNQEPKQRRKKYHRRAVWACDECRLRKIKCNGEEPCQHCTDISKNCTYAGRVRPSVTPTQRIRILEDTLRAVRTALDDLRHTSDPSPTRLDYALSLLDGSASPSSRPEDTPTELSSQISHPTPVDLPIGRPLSRPARPLRAWGQTSSPAIIHRLTALFQSSAASSPPGLLNDTIPSVADLFDAHPPTPIAAQVDLPDDADILDLFASASERSLAAYPILEIRDVRSALRDRDGASARALLHACCANGLINSHPVSQCSAASTSAWSHFSAAGNLLDMTRCDGMTCLQTVLCLTLFAISTGQLWRAHTYSSIAMAWVGQLGLQNDRQVAKTTMATSPTATMLTAIALGFHHFTCSVLALPIASGLQLPQAKNESTLSDNAQSTTESKPLVLLKTELLQTTVDGLTNAFADTCDTADPETIDFARLWVIESTLQSQIEQTLQNRVLFTGTKDALRLRGWVELLAYGCQLKLYFPFLYHLKSMANGTSTSRTRSQRVLACIKTASKTIMHCESLMRQNLLEPSSFSETYTLFLAVLTLLFLIAAHKGTTHPSKAWSQGELGIRILASIRCGENAATKCLRVIRALVQRLSHTVEFDMDEIERRTPTLCSSQQRSLSLTQDRRSTIAAIMNEENEGPVDDALATEQASTADTMLARANDFVLFGGADEYQYSAL